MAETKLYVFAHLDGEWAPCGQLFLTEKGKNLVASRYVYGLRYLTRPDAIEVDPVSLGIGDRQAVNAVPLYPNGGLAFFGGIRDAAPDAWGRRLIETRLKVPANSLPESDYLLHAGPDRVGALDIRRELTAPPLPGVQGWHQLQYLVEAAERIDAGLPIPAQLEAIFDAGSALGGARPKASIRDEQGVLWLAKFGSRSDRFNVPWVEAATLRLAEQCGLTVPAVRTETIANRPVMRIRRFDRYWAPKAMPPAELPDDLHSLLPGDARIEKRLGFVSGLTLLACDELASREKSYGELAMAIRRYCHTDVIRQNQVELFKRMVFNILVSNDDDHLRNHGFLLDPRVGGWRLSPLYDVLPRPQVALERRLHLGVGPQGNAATLDNAYEARERFQLSRQAAAEAIDQVWRPVRQWRQHFEASGVEGIEAVAPAFRRLEEVASAALRRIL